MVSVVMQLELDSLMTCVVHLSFAKSLLNPKMVESKGIRPPRGGL